MKKPLENVTLRVATFQIENVIKFRKINNKTEFIRHSGNLADFFLLLQEGLGFSTYIFEDVDEGIKLKNGTWTGRNGRVHRDEADIGFPTGITYDRLEAVDYTHIFNILTVNFYTKKPEELSKMLAVIYPFNILVC
ncbi:glutamate receptor-like [Centruroides vittatus]|uniref:glutamate receptor-like n=1 Tax=Centruroides vittatus TaxID=120091 RepID=UPI00350FB2F2